MKGSTIGIGGPVTGPAGTGDAKFGAIGGAESRTGVRSDRCWIPYRSCRPGSPPATLPRVRSTDRMDRYPRLHILVQSEHRF